MSSWNNCGDGKPKLVPHIWTRFQIRKEIICSVNCGTLTAELFERKVISKSSGKFMNMPDKVIPRPIFIKSRHKTVNSRILHLWRSDSKAAAVRESQYGKRTTFKDNVLVDKEPKVRKWEQATRGVLSPFWALQLTSSLLIRSNDRTITRWYRQERTNTHNPGDRTDFSFQVRTSLENSSTGTVVLSCWGA